MTTDSEILKAIDDAERALGRLRDLVAPADDQDTDDMRARRMLSVLAEIDRRGGRVPKEEVLSIGEAFGYRRRGMAGFYQELLDSDGDHAALTHEGLARLKKLRTRYSRLSPPPVSHPFWDYTDRIDPKSEPFYRHVMTPKPKVGPPFHAGEAKRELYRR